MSVCTMLRLPVMITSRRWRLTASMRSPSTACEFRPRRGAGQGAGGDQLRHGVHPGRERVVAPGPDPGEQLPGLPAQQQDSLIQHAAEPELVPGDRFGPCRNAQPPAGVPPDPSGSVTIPSRVMNSMTITLNVASLRSMLTGTYRCPHRDSSRPAGSVRRLEAEAGNKSLAVRSNPGIGCRRDLDRP